MNFYPATRKEPVRLLQQLMVEAEAMLRPGIEAMSGLIDYFAGADEAACALTNTSIFDTAEHAKQLDTFQPMLDAGERFAEAGATFERPIMNYQTLWRFGHSANDGLPKADGGRA